MAMKMKKKRQSKIQPVIKKPAKKSADKPAVEEQTAAEQLANNFKLPGTKYVEGVGRRKVATARVRIYEGEGDLVVNNKLAKEYFQAIEMAPALYNKPFEVTNTQGKYAMTAQVTGSGIRSQLGAVIHGLSRALVKHNPEFRIFLKGAGFLTRDDRMKETRKIGMGGKARRKRQSPKR